MAKKYIIKFESKSDRKAAKTYYESEMANGNKNIKDIEKEDKKTLILTAKKSYKKDDILEHLELEDIAVKSVKKFKLETPEQRREKATRELVDEVLNGKYFIVHNEEEDFTILVFAKDIAQANEIATRYFNEAGMRVDSESLDAVELSIENVDEWILDADHVIQEVNNEVEIYAADILDQVKWGTTPSVPVPAPVEAEEDGHELD